MASMQRVIPGQGAPASASKQVEVTPVQAIERAYLDVIARRGLWFLLGSAVVSTACNGLVLLVSTGSSTAAAWHIPISLISLVPCTGLALVAWLRILLPTRDRASSGAQAGQDTSPLNPSATPAGESYYRTMTGTLFSRRTFNLGVAYGVSAVIMLNVYRWTVMRYDATLKYGVFASTLRHGWHLNENTFCLFAGVILYAAVLTLRGTLERGFKLLWAGKPESSIPYVSTFAEQSRTFFPTNSDNQWTPAPILDRVWPWMLVRYIYPSVYALFRKSVIAYTLRLPLIGRFFRPFIINFTRPSHSLDAGVGAHLGRVCLMVLFATDLPLSMILPYLTTPPNISDLRRASNAAISLEQWFAQALKTKNQWYLHFIITAFKQHLAEPSTLARLFTQEPPSAPDQAQIHSIWEQLLLLLGQRHALLLSLRAPPTSAGSATSSAPPPSSAASAAPIAQARIIRDVNVLKPQPPPQPTSLSGRAWKGFTDVLAGGAPIAGPPPIVGVIEQKTASVRAGAASQAREVQAQASAALARGVDAGLERAGIAPDAVRSSGVAARRSWAGFWGREWGTRAVERGLRDVELLRDILDCFVIITKSSVTEDRYGYIQTVVPATMEAIVKHLNELSTFQSNLMAQSEVLGKRQIEFARKQFGDEVKSAMEVCNNAIFRMAEAYGASFKAFSFPPHVQAQLQAIIDAKQNA